MAQPVTDDLVAALDGFSGVLVRPGDVGYEGARRIYNAMIDRRPALIARCQGVADVVAALAFARDNDFPVSIRGGGHNAAGTAVVDDGVMIDLSNMKGIIVDAARRRVRAEGGVTWRELNRETQLHGLAVTGGVVSTTGIAGLTLGGGIGWIMGKYGLAADNLVSAQLVTADGTVVTASDEENADLFWALRGGGGNFGVVTSFEYRLHPVGPLVVGGMVLHAYPAARDLLRFYREFTAEVPDELAADAALVHAPDGSGAQFAGVAVCHTGAHEQALKDLQPLLEFGQPVDVQVGPMPYAAVNQMLDDAYPDGCLNYWKSAFLDELSDSAIDTMIDHFGRCPSPMTAIILEHFAGEVTRIPATATPFPHRTPGYNFLITSVWVDPEATDANVAWTRETYAAMEQDFARRRYANYLDADDMDADPARTAFGPNYDRLVDVKTKYDPHNLFRMNVNIGPRTADVLEP